MKRDISASDQLRKLYPKEGMSKNFSREITFLLTEDCTLRCSYCYLHCKSPLKMTWDVGKRIVDYIYEMWDKNDPDAIINQETMQIILDFIGGEPLLEIELMDKICDYFWKTAIKRKHIWAETFMISMASNGTLYFKPEVLKFLHKYRNHMSYSVSIDGPLEMHDACRVYPDGSGSFKDAYAALQHYRTHYQNSYGTKATIARANLPYLATLIKYYVGEGYDLVHANCVYEEEWNEDDAKLFYAQGKEIADYILNLDKEVETSLFEETFFHPLDEEDNNNWCWAKDTPVLTINGYKPIQDILIGDSVYTEDGTVHLVINTMNHFANNCVLITASGNLPLVCTTDHKIFAKKFAYKGFKSYKYHDCTAIPVSELSPRDLLEVGKLKQERKIDYNINIAYFLGRYIGDGSKCYCPMICCGKTELDELINIFNNAGINFSITTGHTTYDLYARKSLNKDNENYNELCRIINLVKPGAVNKNIPTECFNWSNSALLALIDGYVSADGYISKSDRVKIKTVSYELANELILILRTLGYHPTCYVMTSSGTELFLKTRLVHVHTKYEVEWNLDKTKTTFYKDFDNSTFTSHLKIVPTADLQVYNITVDSNHSYIAGGFMSSNCGGNGQMLAFDPNGDAFPCIRYMHSSLAGDLPPLKIGDCNLGIYQGEYKQVYEMLNSITRRSQSTDECFYCPIASGCSWCSGWNYQLAGTPDKRCTRICIMHKARALFNNYFWNKKYLKENSGKFNHRFLPDEDALKILSQEELDMLNNLENEAKEKANTDLAENRLIVYKDN